MKARKNILGPEHRETLGSMSQVGLTYSLGGRWKEAEELELQVMETNKRVLGKEHRDQHGQSSLDVLGSRTLE